MAIEVGERLPEGTLLRRQDGQIGPVATRDIFTGRRVVLFGVPGPFTGLCSTAHVPSYMRVLSPLTARGVDDVVCSSLDRGRRGGGERGGGRRRRLLR